MTAPLRPDLEVVTEAVRLILEPGQVTELRALEATVRGDRWPSAMVAYFDDHDKLVEAVGTITSATGIYITPNPINPDLLARANNRIRRAKKGESTHDADIIRRRWLLVDVDWQRPKGISATDEEHEAAIDRTRDIYRHLRGQGWPEPIVGDSGNGGHLMYPIDLPTDDGGVVQRCLQALAKRFDRPPIHVDLKVFNPSRIWKLYGTVAAKGDSTADRPHRLARILSAPAALEVAS